MKNLLVLIALAAFPALSQTREVYAGVNTSNYYLNQAGIIGNSRFEAGTQFGFMMAGKSKNIFGNLKRITPFVAFEYNQSHYSFDVQQSEETTTSHYLDVHSARISAPIQVRLSRNDKRAQFYLSGAPGLNLNAVQMEKGTVYRHAPAKSLDLFVNAGAGVLISTRKKSYDDSGFKFSGFTVSADKYIPIHLFGSGANSTSSLDQYQFNVGLRFSYYEKSAAKRLRDRMKIFNRF